MKPRTFTKVASELEPVEASPYCGGNVDLEREKVIFLGKSMSPEEYEVCCRNLREYFDLLQSWQEKESNE